MLTVSTPGPMVLGHIYANRPMSSGKPRETLERMLVIRQNMAVPQAGSSSKETLRRFGIRRRCEVCGTILSRYNSSGRYCFVHDNEFGHSR